MIFSFCDAFKVPAAPSRAPRWYIKYLTQSLKTFQTKSEQIMGHILVTQGRLTGFESTCTFEHFENVRVRIREDWSEKKKNWQMGGSTAVVTEFL